MAIFTKDESSSVESHPLQKYPDATNVDIDDDGSNASSPLVVSLPDAKTDSDHNHSHPPMNPSQYKPCAEQPISSKLPALAHQSTLPHTRAKKPSKLAGVPLHGFVRCIITWLLIVGFYLSLWLYKDKVISPGAKSMFDTITVVLSLAFGLNIASSLKEIALDFRWWILEHRRRPPQEVEFILHCDSMTDLLKMMWAVPRPGTIAACMTWLAINMLAQTGIATLGLTYSAVPSPEDIFLGSAISNISIPNLEHFTPDNDRLVIAFKSSGAYDEAFAAHVLGDIGSSFNYSMRPEQKLDGSPWASNPAAFWNATDHWEYVSLNSTPSNYDNRPGMLSVYTDRTVRSSGVCTTPAYNLSTTSIPTNQYDITGIPGTGSSAPNTSDSKTVVAKFTLLERNETVLFPLASLGVEGTYYLSSPFNESVCGPGCGNIKVVETASGPPAPGSFVGYPAVYFYECNITVTSLPDSSPGSLPHNKASLAARAIALSGAIQEIDDRLEYVYYSLGVAFGAAQNNSATGMASLISRFAIGVVAAAAQTNQPKTVLGHVPTQGLRLTLDYPLVFGLILGLTGGIQVLLVFFTAIACGRLEIPEEIPLSRRETMMKFVLPN